jgi:hypothetical protein
MDVAASRMSNSEYADAIALANESKRAYTHGFGYGVIFGAVLVGLFWWMFSLA